MPKLTVIVVIYNRPEYTKRTIDSLIATCPQDTEFIFYDNHSDDVIVRDYLVSHVIDTNIGTVVFGSSNLGWGGAVNEALKEVKTDYILISNNDVVYNPGWYEKLLELYQKYPNVGVMAVWKHTAHGVKQDLGDLIVKDQMPAVGWLITKQHLGAIGSFPVHGPCSTKGGNGEDVDYCIRTEQMGFLVAAPKEDVAQHIDGM